MKAQYDRCDGLIAVSTALAKHMKSNTGYEATVIPNIVDPAAFVCERKPHEGFRFVTAGNLIPLKNMDALLRAFSRLSHPASLTVFGDGPERPRLEQLAVALRISDRVFFRGRCSREELGEEYAVSDCFVLPSESETFGVAYIEAMAAGLPVIATRCGGPEDFVSEKNGLLIPLHDEEALTGAMEQMIPRCGGYDSRAISDAIRRDYAPAAIGERLAEEYRKCIRKYYG